ncbi:MAG TPA: DUF2007 domain-containing protein [Thermoclostridium caenicola]|uniref:putative signal transducing protein n=1 Tax=Thermoclostridium caenicola TaxID=659425 RepID=UPI002BB3F632|nr:DUF2007 domain-containing protein [Thermoclostridium caenicola]HOK42389.1 DUF2007 domain-containing protein [Thermoclostridium caenicola]HOL83845.1 DUF2007 domain-containing protein [Thermoclostridium caenicola]HPO77480.1 DUF2007 domain-containing protein [Thermoclostridium caenicola]
MPWCPECRREYEKGYKVCADCGSELEDHPDGNVFHHAAYLTTASDSIEADLLEAILREHHIPVMRKYRESGAYLNIIMGNTVMGIDLYVPASSLEDARNLIRPDLQDENDVNMYEVPDTAEDTENIEKDENDEILELRDEKTVIQRKSILMVLQIIFILALLLVPFILYLLKFDTITLITVLIAVAVGIYSIINKVKN